MSEKTLGRYAVFAGSYYYPSGGWDDFVGSFDQAEDATAEAIRGGTEWGGWAHVVDLWTGKVLCLPPATGTGGTA